MKKRFELLKNRTFYLFLLVGLLLFSCQIFKKSDKQSQGGDADFNSPNRPNILWLVTEDIGPYLPSFGDSTIVTPNLSRLAKEGVVYTNLYSTSGVCSPSRAAIATGMYPSGIGANNMRTNSNMKETGLPPYEALPPPQVKMISELLRMNGYYCSNNYKEDYQFNPPVTAWDESSAYAHWRNRGVNQPFFSVFNFTETHESGLFEPYGFRQIETRHYHEGDTSYVWKQNGLPDAKNRMTEAETPVHLPKNTKFKIPPYLPDNAVVRRDMWKLYNNIAETDRQIGAVLKQLEADGLLEKTIIVFYSDHGGPLPRGKRLIYDSGLNTPMIIRYPNKQKAGTKDNQLISFVDFAPTLLSMIGVKAPSYMQGQAFAGNKKVKVERKYIHAAADRFDEVTDVIRAVRDKQFKYIRNYRPEQGYYLPLAYREQIPTMQELLRLHKEGKLNAIQDQWFRKSKPTEELFDCKADPHELVNLASNPKYASKLQELRTEMNRWLEEIHDDPKLPEAALIRKLWNGKENQPQTAKPIISYNQGKLVISCETAGASIGYKVKNKNGSWPKSWTIYQKPVALPQGTELSVMAHRIGYKASQIVEINFTAIK
ncbi:sulfatase family protein [Flavobacterium fluviatile]|uniref:sulfatase family protein n=1 Tax=Flavobacterium fluviatile TaxID=1862387 RepID=UPI0013D18AC3|nr:sulfatase [Flavobacterium fluviatile]